ncbi:hypothetical protein FOA52_001674 [Chlamydomonas sp. UWO 241]|nr:hypothetical protein FOA52_001674 [Chlamydomonas sp. UWO 241]
MPPLPSSPRRNILSLVLQLGNASWKLEALGTIWRLCRDGDPENMAALAAAGAIPELVYLLLPGMQLQAGVQQEASGALSALARNADIAVTMFAAGAIPPLVQLLGADSRDLHQNASSALMYLALIAEIEVAIDAVSAITPLVCLLGPGSTAETQSNAAGALVNLADNAASGDAIAAAGAIEPLVRLLEQGVQEGVQGGVPEENAAKALKALAADTEIAVTIAAAGAIPPLVLLLGQGSTAGMHAKASGALGLLAANAEIAVTIADAGAIAPLVRLLEQGVQEGVQEKAAGALEVLAVDADIAVTIAAAGAIPPLVQLLVQDSTDEQLQLSSSRVSGALMLMVLEQEEEAGGSDSRGPMLRWSGAVGTRDFEFAAVDTIVLNMDLAEQPGGGVTYQCSAAALADMFEQHTAAAPDNAQLVRIPLSDAFPYPGGRVNGGRLLSSGTPSAPSGTAASGSNDDAAKLACRVPCGDGGRPCGALVERNMMRQHVAGHILRLECGSVCGAAVSVEQACGFCGIVGSCDSKLVAGSTKSTKAVASDCLFAHLKMRPKSTAKSTAGQPATNRLVKCPHCMTAEVTVTFFWSYCFLDHVQTRHPTLQPLELAALVDKFAISKEELEAVQTADLKEAFDLFDANGGGSIDVLELRIALHSTGGTQTKEEVRKMMGDIDSDGSGSIDFGEFMQLMTKHESTKDKKADIRDAYTLFDKDARGHITLDDLRRAAHDLDEEIPDEQLQKMLALADIDADGKVDLADFYKTMRKTSAY